MAATDATAATWVTVSAPNRGPLVLIGLAGAVFGGVVLLWFGDPVRSFILVLTGVLVPVWLSFLIGMALVFALITPVLVGRSSGSLHVRTSGDRLRIGRREVGADELHRAYRELDYALPGRYLLRRSIPGMPDPRIEVASSGRPVLGARALDALIALIEQSGLEPDPFLRPVPEPAAGETTPENEFRAELDRRLSLLESRSCSRSTLLAELRQLRDITATEYGEPGWRWPRRWGGQQSRRWARCLLPRANRGLRRARLRARAAAPIRLLSPRWRTGSAHRVPPCRWCAPGDLGSGPR